MQFLVSIKGLWLMVCLSDNLNSTSAGVVLSRPLFTEHRPGFLHQNQVSTIDKQRRG